MTNIHTFRGKHIFSLLFALMSFFVLMTSSVFAEELEDGIIKADYVSLETGLLMEKVFSKNSENFINPQLSTDVYVLGISGSTVEVYDGENKIAEVLIEEGDTFTVGQNSFVGSKISLPLASGEHTLSAKVFLSGHILYKEYAPVTLTVDRTKPVISVYNKSRWASNSTWVRNELIQLYATVSDSGVGTNTDISSVGYDIWDITDNKSIAKSGDSISFSGGNFFLTPEGGFTTGTFTDGHQYRFTFLAQDKAGNENSAFQEFTIDYTNVKYGDNNALFSGGNKGDVHIVGIYDPANPDCETNSQCKIGGALEGYMPFVAEMKVYTNPTHFAFWVDKTKISKRNEGGGIIMFDVNLHGSGWSNKGGRSLYEGGNVNWIDNERGIFKTIDFLKNEGRNREYLRFRDSASNRAGKNFYYEMMLVGIPAQPNLHVISPSRYSIDTGFVIPDISGTVSLSTENQEVRVVIDSIGELGRVIVPAGETAFSIPNTDSKTFSITQNYATSIYAYVKNSKGQSRIHRSVYVDGVPPEILDFDFEDHQVFTNTTDVIVDFSAKDLPFHTALTSTFSLQYSASSVTIKNTDTGNIVKTGVLNSWKSNNDGTYNFWENLGVLPDGKYEITIHLVDKFGNENEEDTVRNFTVDSSSPEILVQIKQNDDTREDFRENSEIFSTSDLEFIISDISDIDFNPEKTFLSFSKKTNGVWETTSVNGFNISKNEDGKTVFSASTTVGEEGQMKYEIQVADTAGNISSVQSGNFLISPRTFEFEKNDFFLSTHEESRSLVSGFLQVGSYIVTGNAPIKCKVPTRSELDIIILNGVECRKNVWKTISSAYNFTDSKSILNLTLTLSQYAEGQGEVLISIDNGLGLVGRIRAAKSEIKFTKNTPLYLAADGEIVSSLGTTAIQGIVTKIESLVNELNFPVGTEITDTFFYDTTLEADSSWRTDSTKSWYSEEKDDVNENGEKIECDWTGTADRCGKSEFPEKALIVSTKDNVYIFDVDTREMWMRFDKGGWVSGMLIGGGASSPTSVFALNGNIYLSFNGNGSGLQVLNFIEDNGTAYTHVDSYGGVSSRGIAERMSEVFYPAVNGRSNGIVEIIDNAVNDIHARVINGKTYIAVATDGGISVINETDGTVENIVWNEERPWTKFVSMTDEGLYFYEYSRYLRFAPIDDLQHSYRVDSVPHELWYHWSQQKKAPEFSKNKAYFGFTEYGGKGVSGLYELVKNNLKFFRYITKDYATLPFIGEKTQGHWVDGFVDRSGKGNDLHERKTKILIIENVKNYYNIAPKLEALGYEVITKTDITTLAEINAENPDIVASFGGLWSATKNDVLEEAYNAGYSVFTEGNDSNAGTLYPILTYYRITATQSGTIVHEGTHPIAQNWTTTGNSGGDTRSGITSIHENAVVLARDETNNVIESFILEETGKGKWFHYQPNALPNNTLLKNAMDYMRMPKSSPVQINPVANGAELTAFEFDGTNYLESDSADFNITGNLTVGAWVKLREHDDWPEFLGIGDDGNMMSFLSQPNGNLTLRVDTPDGQSYNKYISSSENISDEEWHFVSGKIEGNNIFIYIDGNLKKESSFLGEFTLNSDSLRIGARGHHLLNGSIALPFVSSEAYTDEEIKSLYDQTKNWFEEDAKITLQGNSDIVKDIVCADENSPENSDICFVATDDGVITELNTKTGITKLSEKTGTKISVDSAGNILGTSGEISGKFVFAEEKEIIVKTLENLPENSDFTINIPAGIILKNAENENHLKTDAQGKLTFELQAEKTSLDSEKIVSFFQTENPDLKGAFQLAIWGVQGSSEIISGTSYTTDFISGEKILDDTPEFSVKISGRNDDVSRNIKPVFQISKDRNFSAENIIVEKIGENFVTLPKIEKILDESFENGFGDWGTGWSSLKEQESEVVHSGEFSGKFTSAIDVSNWAGPTKDVVVEKNTDYSVSVWVNIPRGQDDLRVIDSAVFPGATWVNPLAKERADISLVDTWQKIEYSFNSGENSLVRFYTGLYSSFSGKIVYFDDIQIIKTSELEKDEYNITQNIQLLENDELIENIPYFARVKSVDEAGRVSHWSSVFAFTKEEDRSPDTPSSLKIFEAGTDIEIPQKGTTTAGSVDVSFLISDFNKTQKLIYEVEIADNKSFSSVFQNIKSTEFKLAGAQKVTIPFLSPAQTYYIRVRAIDDGENIGAWSLYQNGEKSFSTNIKPPVNLYTQALEDVNDSSSLKRYTESNVTFSDRNPSFGFTLPSVDSLPIFLSRSIEGKGMAFQTVLDYEIENDQGSFSQVQKRIGFEGTTSKISETALSGVFTLGTGYIYLDQDSAPSFYRNLLPRTFIAVKNDTKGNFSQKAWSNLLGWIEFSASDEAPERCETASYFNSDEYFSCVDLNGKFQGYARITHPVFLESGLSRYFGENWSEASKYFMKSGEYSRKIFLPQSSKATFEALDDANPIKAKLLTLWEKEGGYLKFSDEKIIALPEELSTEWRPDGVQKRLNIKAGVQNNATPSILINGLDAFVSDDTANLSRNFSLVHLTGTRWEQFTQKTFDITAHPEKAEEMKQFLKNIPEGGILLLTTGNNPSLGRDTWKSELLNFGASEEIIDSLTSDSAYIFVGRKGKSFALYEDVSDSLNIVYSQERAGQSSVDENIGKNALYYGGDTGGFVQSQMLGTLIFYDESHGIASEITGTEDLETATPENSGIIGTAFSTAAGKIYFDADGIFGATNAQNPTADDYGVTIASVNTNGDIFFSGRAWGDHIGFIEMSRGDTPAKCEAHDTPENNFGVCRDSNGAFHGYAWSPSFGWVSFENVYSHDPFSSSGYVFVLKSAGNKLTYEYSPQNIPTGDIELPLAEIQASLNKNCKNSPEECLLPFGDYDWTVRSSIEEIMSVVVGPQKFTLTPLSPELTHQCRSILPLETAFTFTAEDKNVPVLDLEYSIDFFIDGADIDASIAGDYEESNDSFTTPVLDLSIYNGSRVQYRISVENSEETRSTIICENVLIRGLDAEIKSPKDGAAVATNAEFSFVVTTIANDTYTYTVEFQENTDEVDADSFVWSDVQGDTVLTDSTTHTLKDGDTFALHNQPVLGLEIDRNYCWRVKVVSTDSAEAISSVECFSTQNAAPQVSDVDIYGGATLISTTTSVSSASIGQTSDTTPTFEFTVTDDSPTVTATIVITNVSDASNTQTFSLEQPILENGQVNFSMTLPDNQALVELGEYTYVLTVVDASGVSAEEISGSFIIVDDLSGDIGYGNIATEHIDMTNVVGDYSSHRFAYDLENNIGAIDFNPVSGGVHISKNKVYGYAFNAQTGWIRFNCSKNPTNPDDVDAKQTNKITTIRDNFDEYCNGNPSLYGVYPGVLSENSGNFSTTVGALSGNTQDLIGKAKFETIDTSGTSHTEFIYFDIATYLKDFQNEENFDATKWKVNSHGRRAVGIDEKGKISGYAWSPAFGWISMGKDTFDDSNTPDVNESWQSFYPITEYLPKASDCDINSILSGNQTYTAVRTFGFQDNRPTLAVLPPSCVDAGVTFDQCDLEARTKDINGDFIVSTLSLSCEGSTKLYAENVISDTAEQYYFSGTITLNNGDSVSVQQDNLYEEDEDYLKIKILADPKPDFANMNIEMRNARGDGAFANGKDFNAFIFELRDVFGNPIFSDTTVNGLPAKNVDLQFEFEDTIRNNQLQGILRYGEGSAVSIAPSDTLTGAGKRKIITEDNIPKADFLYHLFSYAPAVRSNIDDTFNLESIGISIVDRVNKNLDGDPTLVMGTGSFENVGLQKFVRDDVNTITVSITNEEGEENTKTITTSLFFKKIFEGQTLISETSSTFDENSPEINTYEILLSQLSDFENQLDKDNQGKTIPFHFLHCLDSGPEKGMIEFNPLEYFNKDDEIWRSGKNCYEISSTAGPSQLKLAKRGNLTNEQIDEDWTGNDANVDYTSVDKTMPYIPSGDAPEDETGKKSYSFKTKGERIAGSLDLPDSVVMDLYVAFKTSDTGDWIKYKIDNTDLALKFLFKTGYIEGVTHGERVYETEVTNKGSGVFSQVGSVRKLESIRNALTKNLAQYIAEEGGRQEGDLFRTEVKLPSNNISAWLKGGEEEAVSLFPSDKIQVLDGGNMIWIRGEGDAFTVEFGDGGMIDDEGIGSSKTLVIEGGNVTINGDIFRRGGGSFAIIVLRHPDQLYEETQWDNSGNILIDPNVKNIRAMMYADGSVFSYDRLDGGGEGVYDGFSTETLSNQLYILGSVSSLNTYGGSYNISQENVLSGKNVWHSPEYISDPSDSIVVKRETIRFDLKRLRDFTPEKSYADDLNNDGIRDSIDGGAADLAFCEAELSAGRDLPEYCLPEDLVYDVANASQASFFENDVEWDNDVKAQTSVIFEYDENIQKNPAPGTVIFTDLVLD